MPQPKELSEAEIQEILSMRKNGVPISEIRKRSGIGTTRLYRLLKNGGEGKGPAAAPAANGKGQTTSDTPDPNSKTARAPAGAAPAEPTDAAVLQALKRIEEQMTLLLEAQEGHYEDLEELEGTVDQAIEEGANILDTLEEGSQKARTTAENVLAVTIAVRDISLAVLGIGGLSLLLWTFYPAATRVYENMTKAKASSPAPAPPALTPSADAPDEVSSDLGPFLRFTPAKQAPVKPVKKGITNME